MGVFLDGIERSFAGRSAARINGAVVWAEETAVTDYGPAVTITNTATYSAGKIDNAWDNPTTALMQAGPIDYTGTDWTIEAWVYASGSLDTRTRFAVHGGTGTTSAGTTVGLGILRATAGAKPSFQMGGFTFNYGSTLMPMNEWVHLAISKLGTTVRLFMNGVLQNNTTGVGTSINWPAGFQLGAAQAYNSNNRWIGKLDEIRISKVARYTSNSAFTPPTERFVVDDNTLALYHMDGSAAPVVVSRTSNLPLAIALAAAGTQVAVRTTDLPTQVSVTATGIAQLSANADIAEAISLTAVGWAVENRSSDLAIEIAASATGEAVETQARTAELAVVMEFAASASSGRTAGLGVAIALRASGVAVQSRTAGVSEVITLGAVGWQVQARTASLSLTVGLSAAGATSQAVTSMLELGMLLAAVAYESQSRTADLQVKIGLTAQIPLGDVYGMVNGHPVLALMLNGKRIERLAQGHRTILQLEPITE